MAAVRVRQHVNPLSRKFQIPVSIPDWTEIYASSGQSLHLDIGCGRGRFVLAMAAECPTWNFLGLEIRKPLVQGANQERDRLRLTNVHVIFCNANLDLGNILASFPMGTLQYVTIQFPDPWFKQRHRKRRVVQPQLLDDLAAYLNPSGHVLLQSDVEEVAIAMVNCFAAHPAFEAQQTGWLMDNPLPIPTEREQVTQAQGLSVYRQLYRLSRAMP